MKYHESSHLYNCKLKDTKQCLPMINSGHAVTCIHLHTQMCKNTHNYEYTHNRSDKHKQSHTQTRTHTNIYTRTHSGRCRHIIHVHTHTHTCTYTYTWMHMNVHTPHIPKKPILWNHKLSTLACVKQCYAVRGSRKRTLL